MRHTWHSKSASTSSLAINGKKCNPLHSHLSLISLVTSPNPSSSTPPLSSFSLRPPSAEINGRVRVTQSGRAVKTGSVDLTFQPSIKVPNVVSSTPPPAVVFEYSTTASHAPAERCGVVAAFWMRTTGDNRAAREKQTKKRRSDASPRGKKMLQTQSSVAAQLPLKFPCRAQWGPQPSGEPSGERTVGSGTRLGRAGGKFQLCPGLRFVCTPAGPVSESQAEHPVWLWPTLVLF